MLNFRLNFSLIKPAVAANVTCLPHRCKTSTKRRTAGLIVIGDEILKAQIRDSNSYYALRLLHKHGVKVKKVSVVADDLKQISDEIREFSCNYDHVVTCGGIGPTHDDVTFEALSMAFDDARHYHPVLVDVIRSKFGYEDRTSPSYKMAYIPRKATLKFGVNKKTQKKLLYPCVNVENVYVFPGSPSFFEASFASLCEELFGNSKGFATAQVYLNAREESFANVLTKLAADHPNVSFGSYPENNRYYKTRVSIEGDGEEETAKAKKAFLDSIPAEFLSRFSRDLQLDSVEKYKNFLRACDPKHRRTYEHTFAKLVDFYQSEGEVSTYLDGSAESAIILHMAHMAAIFTKSDRKKLRAVYKRSDFNSEYTTESTNNSANSYFRGESFLREMEERYNVDLFLLHQDGCGSGSLQDYLTENNIKRLMAHEKAVSLKDFEPEDGLELYFPLSEWSSQEIRGFLEFLYLPYE